MIPAVVVGTHTMGLGVIRALGRLGIPVIALYHYADDMGFVSRYVQESIHVPDPESDESHFLECLINLGSRIRGSPLFPVSDESLKVIARNRSLLQGYYRVACAEWEIVQKMLQKNLTYKLAQSIGIPIPYTIMPESLDDVRAGGQDLGFPCLVKPVESHRYHKVFRRKMVKAENPAQMILAYEEAECAGFQVVLQEFIPGEDSLGVNYNSYFWNGQPMVEFTAQKVRSAPPELGSPCVAVSRQIPAVFELGRRLLKALNYYGYSCTEFKRDLRDGIPKLMEVNCRHNLSTLLAVSCGVNFPWLHYRHLVEGIVPEATSFQEGLFWVDTERDLPYIPNRIFRLRESLSQILEPYVHPHVAAVYDPHDIKPFVKRYVDFGRKALHRILKTG